MAPRGFGNGVRICVYRRNRFPSCTRVHPIRRFISAVSPPIGSANGSTSLAQVKGAPKPQGYDSFDDGYY